MFEDFPTSEELQEMFKKKFEEIINFIKDYSPYHVLAYFYSNYKMCLVEENDKTQKFLESKKIMYLQILFLCTNDGESKNEKIEKDDLERIEKYIEELQDIIQKYEFVRKKDEELTPEERDYLVHAESFKDWCGKRYDIFEIQHHKDLLGCLKEEFNLTYNFELDDLYDGISELKNNFYFEFEECINNFNDLLNEEDIKINEDGTFDIPDELDANKQSKLEELGEKLFSLKLVDIQENTKWTTEFLDRFVIDVQEIQSFIENISIENWNKILNKVKYKPLIKIDDRYYMLLEQRFYDNFDKEVIKGICEKNSSNAEKIRAKFTSNIENSVMNYFNNILESKECYNQNYFTYNGKILENDILIVLDNNIFIVEVKAGNFTPELASEDLNSHKEALKNLIVKANEQQDCLEKCLIENKTVSIYDSNNKKTRNKKTEILLNENTKIFRIIITAESFNDIEARIDKVKLITLSPNTLVMSLDDLRVYSDYFKKHPCYFIQYLLQREKAIGNKNMDLYDELYHLGMWLEYNYYNEYTNEQINKLKEENGISEEFGVVSICGEDWMEELDNYYNSLWFKRKTIEKPFREIPKETNKIIEYCEQNCDSENCIDLAIFLINLNSESLQQIEKILIDSREFFKKVNRAKYRLYVVIRKK